MILPTEVLKKMVDEITNIEAHNAVMISFMLRNRQDANFSINDGVLTRFIIKCDFMNNVTDDIQATLSIRTDQFQKLVTCQSDLYADILLEYVDTRTGEVLIDEAPLKLQYNVFVHNLADLSKKIGIQAFEDVDGTDTSRTRGVAYIDVNMQLISEKDYSANRASFSGLMIDVAMDDTVKYLASMMQVGSVSMVPADNTTKYKHVTIPPDKGGFRAIFDYLQSKYGIYAKGFRHYITEGKLYVYPPFDMETTRSPRLKVIRVSENSYLGMPNYHKLDGQNLTIVSNTELQSKSMNNVGSENEGNTKLFIRSDGMLDGQVDKTNGMKLRDMSAIMSSKSDSSIKKGSAIPKYVPPTMNLYGHASTFSETNTEVMVFGWPNARIKLIQPGMPVSFIFDEKKSVMERKGTVESVIYEFVKSTRTVFNCGARIAIRSDPKVIPYDT